MTPAETAELLALAAAFDNRTVSEVAARAWAEAIAERVTPADAKRVIVEHYARTREWIMPSDINAGAAKLRGARLDKAELPDPPDDLPVVDEMLWRRAYWRAIGDGLDEEAADRFACERIGVDRPQIEAAARPIAELVASASEQTRLPADVARTAMREHGIPERRTA